ncbi:M48 family metallopeptidase [Bdellovibrionota bacterium]
MKFVPKIPKKEHNLPPKHPLKEFLALLLGIGVIVVVTFLVLGIIASILAKNMSIETEEEIFDTFYSRILSKTEELSKPNEYLQNLADNLASHEQVSFYDYEVRIICEEKPNALAIPGGNILITSGLINMLETEIGLAMVLAHEMGHFKNRDHLRSLGRGLVLLSMSVVLGNSGANLLTSLLNLTELSFSREQEEEADKYGQLLVKATYGNLNGADEFFRKLEERGSVLEKIPTFLSTHPASKSRIIIPEYVDREEIPLAKIPPEIKEIKSCL